MMRCHRKFGEIIGRRGFLASSFAATFLAHAPHAAWAQVEERPRTIPRRRDDEGGIEWEPPTQDELFPKGLKFPAGKARNNWRQFKKFLDGLNKLPFFKPWVTKHAGALRKLKGASAKVFAGAAMVDAWGKPGRGQVQMLRRGMVNRYGFLKAAHLFANSHWIERVKGRRVRHRGVAPYLARALRDLGNSTSVVEFSRKLANILKEIAKQRQFLKWAKAKIRELQGQSWVTHKHNAQAVGKDGKGGELELFRKRLDHLDKMLEGLEKVLKGDVTRAVKS